MVQHPLVMVPISPFRDNPMSLASFSVNRHVFTLMVSVTLMLFGVISMQRIGVDKFPEVEYPVMSIVTILPGADPAIIDKNITDLIEETVNQVPGVDTIQSNSSLGVSVVIVRFDLDKKIDVAYQETNARIDGIVRQLPVGTDPPVVQKIEVGAFPVLWLALQGDRTEQQLSSFANEVIKPQLESIRGVGQVTIAGARKRTIRIWLSNEKLHAYHLSPAEVRNAFLGEHIALPGGFLSAKSRELLVKLDAEFASIKSMRKLIVAYRQGAPIYLEDIAEVEDGMEDQRRVARFNGAPAVGIGIVKSSGANTIALVDLVKEKVEKEISPNLPPGMRLNYSSDDSTHIRESVASLKEHLILGTIFAAILVFVFLKSIRSTLIIATAIPVSLLSTFAIMYFAGFTFNIVTLLGLLLLIGVVVDDAIVVLENIYRHREEGHENPWTAAVDGTNEVMFAVVASTFTLASIFLPVAFIPGMLGRFLSSFALVVVGGLMASLFVALTLIPMLTSRFLVKLPDSEGPVYSRLERFLSPLDRLYRRMLHYALDHSWKVVTLAIAVILSSAYFFGAVGKNFIPVSDEGQFIVRFETPLGANFHYTEARMKEIEAVIAKHSTIQSYFSAIGLGETSSVNQGVIFVNMHGKDAREISQAELMATLRKQLSVIPGVDTTPTLRSMIGGQRGEPLQFAVQGADLTRVSILTDQMISELEKVKGIVKFDKDMELELPEVRLLVDRERAAQLGINAQNIAMAVRILTGGVDIADFRDGNQRYRIRLQARNETLGNINDLKRLFIKNRFGELVRLDSLVRFEKGIGPAVITRRDRQYAGMVYANLDGIALGDATNHVDKIADKILPAGYSVSYLGQAEEFAKTGGYVLFAFSFALIMVYIVLASQFNSFVQPLLVMVAQPLAVIGGVMALWLFRDTLNMFSMIGMILLMGLVAKNAILLIDLTNQYRAKGMDIYKALHEACPKRLRPVLITSLTVISVMLPPAFGLGPGAEINRPLAIVVMGGMITSTLLTLVVVPVVYRIVEEWRGRKMQAPGS